MLKIITNNFWIKIICLLIATGIWIYVANSESKVDNFPGSITVDIRNKPSDLVVIRDSEFCQLRILAERGVWKQLSAESFEAYIDLAGYSEGTYEVLIKVNSNINGVQIVEIKPAKILVRLEPLISKEVPVAVNTEGTAAEGYTPGESATNPSTVKISGPSSIIKNIDEVIATIKLNNESEKIIGRIVNLSAYNEQKETINNIEFDPPQVSVDLSIVKSAPTKTVGIKVKTVGSPDSNFWISQITTDPATIVITGQPKNISQTEFIETDPINVNQFNADKNVTIGLNLPAGISLFTGQKNQVAAKIKLSAVNTQKEIVPSINYNNLSSGLRVANLDPSSIKVIVSGAVNRLADLNSNDVAVNFNLSGRGNGTFSETIASENISAPDGISVVSIVPSAIRITLENK